MFSKVIKKIRHKTPVYEESVHQESDNVQNPRRQEKVDIPSSTAMSSPDENRTSEMNYTYESSHQDADINNSKIPSGENNRTTNSISPHRHHKHRDIKRPSLDLQKPLPAIAGPPASVMVTCGFENGIQKFSPQTLTTSIHFPHYDVLRKYQHFHQMLAGLSPDRIVLQYYDSSVYKEDIDNLEVDEWLNDNNISFIYEYLKHTVMAKILRKSPNIIQLVKPSIAYLLLHTQDIESMAVEMQSGLRNAQFLFLPINDNPDVSAVEGGTHWSLMVISIVDRKALYYDSMYEGFVTSAAARMRKQMSRLLRIDLELISVMTPQQLNGSDCGVIVVEITALLLNRLVHETGQINLECGPMPLAPHAGRTFILSRILQLSAKRAKELKI
jgi:sentrin-specific protease 8